MSTQSGVNMPFTTANIMVLLSVILMDLLVGMEFDLFVPSFPALQSQFQLTPFWVEALLSANFVGFCISLFFVGGLADRYGRKPIILVGLITFIIGSVLCLWVPFYPALLIGRFLQGIGIAAPAILSFLIIADTYPLKQQQFLMAMLNGSMNTAAAIAPVIGSYITLYFHWQGNFTALLLLGFVTWLMTLLFIPRYQLPAQDTKFNDAHTGRPQVAPTESSDANVFKLSGYKPLFQSKPLLLLMVAFVLSFVPYWIFVGMSPLLYMQALGVSLKHFGYYQGVLALTFAIGCLLFGLVMRRFNQKSMLYVAGYIYIFSMISIVCVTLLDNTSPLMITLAFIPFIIGQIIPTTLLYPLCLNLMPDAKARVSAVIQGGRLIVAALSLQLAGYFYHGTFQPIGIIIAGFIAMVTVTLFLVTRRYKQYTSPI